MVNPLITNVYECNTVDEGKENFYNMPILADDEEDWDEGEVVSDDEMENGQEESMDFGNRSVLSSEVSFLVF